MCNDTPMSDTEQFGRESLVRLLQHVRLDPDLFGVHKVKSPDKRFKGQYETAITLDGCWATKAKAEYATEVYGAELSRVIDWMDEWA